MLVVSVVHCTEIQFASKTEIQMGERQVVSVGSCRRDLLDHVIVLNERHLKRLMFEHVRYYHEDRTHLSLANGTPAGRKAATNLGIGGRIIAMPRLGGLHHRYDQAA